MRTNEKMSELKQKIALFIDADNAPASKFEEVLSEVAKYGVVTIRKAYGNWKNSTLKPWEDLLHEYAIQPIQQYDLTKGKNASDIALVIDAMDVMYTKNIKSDTKLINLLRQAIDATEEDNGWAALGPVGAHISNKTSFDTRNYGYKNLSSLIKAIDLFELKRGQGNSYLVRDTRKKKTT